MKAHCRLEMVLLIGIVMTGCSSEPPRGGAHVKTYLAKAIVQVDGTPTKGVRVNAYPQGDTPEGIKYMVSTSTGESGEIIFTTYKLGDGLPVGDYALTFVYEKVEPGVEARDIKDSLNGAYSDPTKSTTKITIAKGSPNDFGVIELSTKEPGK